LTRAPTGAPPTRSPNSPKSSNDKRTAARSYAAGHKPTQQSPGKIPSKQTFTPATGLGSIDAARGSYHLVDTDSGAVLQGEIDVTGAAWDAATWSAAALAGTTWSGNTWLGRTWSGSSWSGRTWSGRTWSGDAYSSRTWTGTTWSGGDWASRTWSSRTWSSRTWSGRTWSSADLDPTATSGA
jgi:hypothetical protein